MNVARLAWTAAGTLFLGLGIAGVILPVMPGTVFLLAASACYIRGSKRLHTWLHSHPQLGPHLRAVADGRGMPMRARVIALAMMWIGVAFSIHRVDLLLVEAMLVLLAIIGTAFITRPRLMRIVSPSRDRSGRIEH